MTQVRPTRGCASLDVVPLEDRCTPATAGVPWLDGTNVTLSFVPDGTSVGGTPSTLHRTLDAVAPRDVWQREVVRAFRAWADHAGIEVGVRDDGGQPLGTPGAVQGDARFGDIRVAAAPLPAGTLATNTPFQWSGTTWSGDVVLNTNYRFGTDRGPAAYDLYSLMLNEAGNVFGATDTTTDPTSAVYHRYAGPRDDVSAADVADIQSLYGMPVGDPGFDATFRGDLASADGAYEYAVEAPAADAPQKLNVIVWTGGAGRDAPAVEVLAAGSDDPLPARVLADDGGTYSVELTDTTPGATYVLRVTAPPAAGPWRSESYTVGSEFSTQPATESLAPVAADGTTLTVDQNQLYQFALAGEAARVDIVDAADRVVFSMGADSGHAYLPAGTYTVRVRSDDAADGFTLTARVASDPIGPVYTDETGGGSGATAADTASRLTPTVRAAWDMPYLF